ncbi:MAG: 50S ribosomal protein L11 [Blastochloris sp.]|nr:50S ribosomal protein L11 [Blastochloris sp.]
MAKKLVAVVKLQLQAGKATPAPPVGPALGQHGINIMAFVKEYNEKTAAQVGGVVPAEISIFSDRSFTLKLTTPPASDMLRKAAGVNKGSSTPSRATIGTVSRQQLRELAQQKLPDLNAIDIENAEKILAGTARSMGIQIED